MILPLVAELLGRVGRHPAVEQALEAVRGGAREVRLAGLTDAAKALLAAHAAATLDRPILLLVESNRRAEALLEPLRFFFCGLTGRAATQVAVLPAHDVLPYQQLSPHPEISEARAVALWRLASRQASLLLVPVVAAAMRLQEPACYRDLARTLGRDLTAPLDELVAHLLSVGYERCDTVEMPGQFALRGGILDVFSPEALRPVRLELFGDTLESLREFDPATQRSVRTLERVTLLPLTDVPRTREQLARVHVLAGGGETEEETRYAGVFPGWEFVAARAQPPGGTLFDLCESCLAVWDEPDACAAALEGFRARLDDAFARAGKEAAPPGLYYLGEAEWLQAAARLQRLKLEHLALDRPGRPTHVLPTQPTTRYHGNVPAFFTELRSRVAAGEDVLLAAASTGEMERLAGLCHEFEMPYRLGVREDTPTMTRLAEDSSAGSVPAATLVKAPLPEGLVVPDLGWVLFGSSDLFETLPVPERPRRRAAASFFSDFRELKPGDYVVHIDHGIGEFQGLRQVATDGQTGEFMLLRYADDARLYVPLARLDLVQKYTALGGVAPALDKLGGTAWVTRKKRARRAVAQMADELLRLYAERKTVPGFGFSADVPWQNEFEDAFEFEETPDQARAITEVKRDLERAAPMDRLLCGDVGYGKTEVAMRAAFKAVCDGKQVAVLAPTTVLAFQHYQTFRRRMAAFPVRIEMLSRFRTPREQQQTLAGLEGGSVDVVIGTHRLLSRDVRFHDLGLLVVDEEQRFGVSHKERIKQMRSNVDVLTLSATPIPRTLHMSLVGLRDMSVMETPPRDRLAIQTVVAPFSEALLQSAIEQELARDGQVYVVHNRVESIASLAALVGRLVPRARLLVGHGQLPERALEQVMLRFIRHEADVLVATTIIENGLDIPRCNTILINRADRFGLSELYQLRGRVGRSNQRAYAYLLVPPEAALAPLAKKRLAALREFSELGAGFRIAALDLELRGAGNLLGPQQHGHINAVGFDLYCQMMERAVAERKGEAPPPELRATINLGLDIRIPPDYVASESLRLRAYKRIAGAASDDDRREVLRELEDRFGPPPPAVGNLLDYAVLKALCERLLVASVDRRGDQIALRFYEQTPVRPEQVVELVRSRPGMRLDPSGVLWVAGNAGEGGPVEAARKVLLQLQA